MASFNATGFDDNIAFLKANEVDYPFIQWVVWPGGVPPQLQHHVKPDGGGYICALVDDKTNVFMYKQKHTFDANMHVGGYSGWPPHVPAFHATPAAVKPKVDYMAITREMCAGR